jgi:hypothetical protein
MSPFEVKELIARLHAAYPGSPMSAESEEVYGDMLRDLEYPDVDLIVDELIATSMRLPTISRIRRAVIDLVRRGCGCWQVFQGGRCVECGKSDGLHGLLPS